MEGEEENVLNEDLDVGDNFHTEVKVENAPQKRRSKQGRPGPRSRCPYGCEKFLAPRTIDYHRCNGCRMATEDPLGDTGKRRNFCCGVCFSEFVTRPGFLQHLKSEHDIHAEVHRVVFKTREHFDRFIKWLEMEGGAHFRHKSGAKRRATGKGIFMGCNRSGFVGSQQSADPLSTKNRTGPYRSGYTCTAFVHGTEHTDGTVEVEVCGDHYGHDARMRLPNVVKQLIAQKQMDGESTQEILRYLKRQFASFAHENIYAQRVCLVDHEELRTLMMTSTKRWEMSGIPTDCELWEEELLDKAGISREGVPRLRELDEPTTQELAESENWPRPRVFIAKVRTDAGFVEVPELCRTTAEVRRLAASATEAPQPDTYAEVEDQEEILDEEEPEEEYGAGNGAENGQNGNGADGTGQRNQAEEQREMANPPAPSRLDEVLNVDHPPAGNESGDAVRVAANNNSREVKGSVVTRQMIVTNIFTELEQMDKMVQVQADGVSDAVMMAFLNRLRAARQTLGSCIAGRHGLTPSLPVLSSSTRSIHHPSFHAKSRAKLTEDGRASATATPTPVFNNQSVKTEQVSAADLMEEPISDDEPIMTSIPGLRYNAAMWS